jgi:hypothetical protein
MAKPNRKNRRSHKKAALQRRRPPKRLAPAPKHRSRASVVPQPVKQGTAESKTTRQTATDIRVLYRRKTKNIRLQSPNQKRTWLRRLRTLLKKVWDWAWHHQLFNMPYKGA